MLGLMESFPFCTILNDRFFLSLHILFCKIDFKFRKYGRTFLSFPIYLENRAIHVSGIPVSSVYTLMNLSLEFQALSFSLLLLGFKSLKMSCEITKLREDRDSLLIVTEQIPLCLGLC